MSAGRQHLLAFLLLVGLTTLYVCHSAQFFDFIPFWDGWEFFRHCYQAFASDGQCECFGHCAAANSALFATVLLPSQAVAWPIYVLALGLGLVGMLGFYMLLRYLIGDRLSPVERVLITFLFGMNPVFHAQVIQPSLDFALPVHLIFLLVFLLKERFLLATLAGLLLVFTKEPGIMLYGVTVSCYAGLNWLALERRGALPRLRVPSKAWSLAIPAVAFFAYAMGRPPQKDAGGNWGHVVGDMFRLDMTSPVVQRQFASLLVLNFSWLLSAIIVAGLCVSLVSKPTRGDPAADKDWRLVYGLFITCAFFMTRVVFVNNPRYMLPLLPLLILAFGNAIAAMPLRRLYRISFLTITLVLVHASSYRTIDPVSKMVFGTFEFGEHRMLRMAATEHMHDFGYGRDQLVYNSEFTQLHYLTERVVRELGLDATYVTNHRMSWTEPSTFSAFDPVTACRTVDPRAAHLVNFDSVQQLLSGQLPERIHFIEYPQMVDPDDLRLLAEHYEMANTHIVSRCGYTLRVLSMRRCESMISRSSNTVALSRG